MCIDKEVLQKQILNLIEDTHAADPTKDVDLVYKVLDLVLRSTVVSSTDLFKASWNRQRIAEDVCNRIKLKLSYTDESNLICIPSEYRPIVEIIDEVQKNYI